MADVRDEHYWAERAFERHYHHHDRLFEASVASGRQALQAALLLSGGACIALLGFLANTFDDEQAMNTDQARLVNAVVQSLVWFGWGALCAAAGAAGGYLTNLCYGERYI